MSFSFCYVLYYMHFPQLLLKSKIFIMKLPKYLLLIFLASNAFFTPKFHVKAVQDGISAKTGSIWLHHTVNWEFKIEYIFNICILLSRITNSFSLQIPLFMVPDIRYVHKKFKAIKFFIIYSLYIYIYILYDVM